MTNRRVAVLGCGPAGLLAAHAAHVKGARSIKIFSKPEPSFIYGAQFLHRPIPLLTRVRPDGHLLLTKMGSPEGYALKVYGNKSAPTSWNLLPEGKHDIWSMTDTYERLFDWYGRGVEAVDLSDGDNLRDILFRHNFELVISSVPAKVLCQNPAHKFESQSVWIVQTGGDPDHPNEIKYNGGGAHRWYRWSCIFGHESFEYPEPPGISYAVKINKPLVTDCDCWQPSLLRVGRYGAWQKSLLAHHAFEAVMEVLSN